MNEPATSISPRVALVTGGAKGIGAGIATRLARDGWRVVVADRDASGPLHRADATWSVMSAMSRRSPSWRGVGSRRAAPGRADLQCRLHDPQADREH